MIFIHILSHINLLVEKDEIIFKLNILNFFFFFFFFFKIKNINKNKKKIIIINKIKKIKNKK